MKFQSYSTILVLALGTVLLCAAPAMADVTIEEKLRVEGEGLMRFMNMSGTSVTRIANDRARTDTDLQMESRMMRRLSRTGPTAEIVRLDEDTVISLDLRERTYFQTTFAEQQAELEQAMAEMRESQQAQQQGMSGIDESQCEWSDATVSVERSGATATFAGYQAEQLVLTASQSCRNPETGEVCGYGLRLEQWIAPEFEAAPEVLSFYQAYAARMGLDATASRSFAERAESMFAGYEGIWQALTEHMEALDGYPVKSSISLSIGGPQCESIRSAEGAAGAPGLGEVVGGALGGRLGGALGRRRDDSRSRAEAEAPADTPGDGMLTMMTISNELVSVSRAPVAADTFEVPAGFRRVNR